MVIVLAVATCTDVRSRRIPNWLVLPFLLSGIAVSCWLHGWHGLGQSSAGFGMALLVYGALFWMGGMGAGDVKLCAAIGAWIGPNQLLVALVMISLVGGAMALCWAIWSGFLLDLLKDTGNLCCFWHRRGVHAHARLALDHPAARKMPYAPAIAIGTLLSFLAVPR
jgi:prepilin peptidase CpaA